MKTLPSIGVGIFGAVVVMSVVAAVGWMMSETKGKNYDHEAHTRKMAKDTNRSMGQAR